MTVIHIYAPITDAEKRRLMSFMVKFNLNQQTRKQDVPLAVGDWNAKVRYSKEENIVGLHALGKRHEAK